MIVTEKLKSPKEIDIKKVEQNDGQYSTNHKKFEQHFISEIPRLSARICKNMYM